MIEKVKRLLANIPRQQFLYYNKQQFINVIIGCYEQVRNVVDKINEFITKVNAGEYNGEDADIEGAEKAIEDCYEAIDNTNQAISNANDAAQNANNKAQLADNSAQNADGAASNANAVAQEYEDEVILNRQKADNAVTTANGAVATANSANSIANNANSTSQSALNTAEEAKTIAKGRATGYVFDDLEDMEEWLEDPDHVDLLVVGDNLYIRDTEVPDYWWDGEEAQPLETQKVDLSEYAKFTDWATSSTGGVVKVSVNNGIGLDNTNILYIQKADDSEIIAKSNNYKPLVPANLDKAVAVGISSNTITLTNSEQAAAKRWLGFSPITEAEYEALVDKTGINFVIPADYDNE